MESRKLPAGQITAIIVAGLGIGWLAGLSLSPVAHVVITSLIGGAAAIVSAFAGLPVPVKKGNGDEKDKSPQFVLRDELRAISAMPIAVLVVSIAIGASGGVYVRSHNWLGSQIPASSSAPTTPKKTGESSGKPDYRTGGLFAGDSVDLKLLAAHDQTAPIIAGLAGAKNDSLRRFATNLQAIQDGGKELTATDVLQKVCEDLIDDE